MYSWVWCCMLLIPALGKEQQANLCEFEANLSYKVSAKSVRANNKIFVSKIKFTPVIPALGRQEDQKFKVILIYTLYLRLAWAT